MATYAPPLIVLPADVEFVNNEESDDERQIGDSDGSVGTAEADKVPNSPSSLDSLVSLACQPLKTGRMYAESILTRRSQTL
ncbi:uncharacterized protein LOC114358716 isoform X2 [Ostrinia furnacalis]|uniref:uncharacterized protein LOC114358716 isoform X2 n=1 Tax=Ostrinia furnacalis TaxID=93504 RepID=UPI00103C4C04|nr:uncharacterized protein LOC114358716 isoform X2 [Ostrinia furnacalis]